MTKTYEKGRGGGGGERNLLCIILYFFFVFVFYHKYFYLLNVSQTPVYVYTQQNLEKVRNCTGLRETL